MAEWLGTGLQNRIQQFDSARYLKKGVRKNLTPFFITKLQSTTPFIMAKQFLTFICLIVTHACLLSANNDKQVIFYEDFGGNDINDSEICTTPLKGCFYEHITDEESHSGSYSLRKIAFFNGNRSTRSQWYSQSDHTYDKDYTRGYFLQIDGSLIKEPFYIFNVDKIPSHSTLEFSIWVVNCYTAYQKEWFEEHFWKVQEPDFDIIIFDEKGKEIARHHVGPIKSDKTLYRIDDYTCSAKWEEITFEFTTTDISSIRVMFFNTGIRSPGNDYGIDDIRIYKKK